MKKIWIFAVLLGTLLCSHDPLKAQTPRREVAFTIDDLPHARNSSNTSAKNLGAMQAMTRILLATLVAHHVPAIGFVNEHWLYVKGETDARIDVLRMWLDAGMTLGNHTFSHAEFNKLSLQQFEDDVIRGEVVTRQLMQEKGFNKLYFRYPYNHTGITKEAKDGFEEFLRSHNYEIAPFTIENEDYVFNDAYMKARRNDDKRLEQRIRTVYLDFLDTIFDYCERKSKENLGYEVKQVLLIHANEINADCLNEMILKLERRGYSFVTLDRALHDKAYKIKDDYVGKYGISWLHRWTVSLGLKISNYDEPDAPKFVMDLYQAN